MPAELIIDAWIQHPTVDFARHPMFASFLRWLPLDSLPEVLPDELTIGALDAGGISQAVLTAWHGPEGPLLSNDEVARLVRKYPDRLVGVASVDLHRPMVAVRELRRRVKEDGFRGLRMLPWLWRLPPNDRRYYPLYAECVELGVPFCLQVGHTGPTGPSEPGRPIPYLEDVAEDFPELVILAGHTGFPWTDEMISLARRYPNVYIDTSAYKPRRYPPQLVSYMRGSGRKKVVFASDWPMIMPADCISQIDELGLDAEARRMFLHDNAAKIFKLSP
ncbi:MAG: putative TIM-barrel fold metal-dependent hydrolase [Myxococcota bacterium]|jgi:predicted TIM-barrel fold metal-dependent hydrolase